MNPELNPSELERDVLEALVLLEKPLVLGKKRSGKQLATSSYSRKSRGSYSPRFVTRLGTRI